MTMNNPAATYRLQFNKDFNFKDFEAIIPYLRELGVSTIYASPIFESTPGSTHGYDGVDPTRINAEIGSIEALKMLSKELKSYNIGWLQDIVPNHMAFHSDNPWLMDVLEKGSLSNYAHYFDIAWDSDFFGGKLMVPFLASDVEQELANGDLMVIYSADRFWLRYKGATFPLSPKSYAVLFDDTGIAQNQALAQIGSQIEDIGEPEDAILFSLRWDEILLQLSSLMRNERERDLVDVALKRVNSDKARLRQIIDRQTYVLCEGQVTDNQINFRRFFTVNGLICVNIQNEEVFCQYHSLVKTLADESVIQGLRIDHVDGLFDPTEYLERIRQLAGDDTYIVVEKILGPDENLPEQWPVEGTTGYEFLAAVNNLFTNKAARQAFTDFYEQLTGEHGSVEVHLLKKKALILYGHMGGELENLYQLFVKLNLAEVADIEKTGDDHVKNAIGQFLIHCPVYRYYGNKLPVEAQEFNAVQEIFNNVKTGHPQLATATGLLEYALLIRPVEGDEDFNGRALAFYQRCMQFTGPLMAKGVEDTLMYTYERFIGHNDVGDSAENFGLSVKEFHGKMKYRQKHWPLSLNATSTHDTKRGEDVRARLNVLTDLADEWILHVKKWVSHNALLRGEFAAPDANDEYLIYQTMVGAYPMPGEDEKDFESRFKQYLQKALREAKTNTNWTKPNEKYETGTSRFADRLLDKQGPFWESFQALHREIVEFGVINSLSQLVLKFTCPGVPDVYQGCELWDFSLVDPDNRRPVDFELRAQWLKQFSSCENRSALIDKLWKNRNNAQIKLWLTQQLFALRRKEPDLFLEGDYSPLEVKGIYKNEVMAFARIHRRQVLIVVIPLHVARLCKQQEKDLLNLDWKDTAVMLPKSLETAWQNVLSGQAQEFKDVIPLSQLLTSLPVSIMEGCKKSSGRNAGVLMHLSSLTSPFGIGDMGPEAFAFADFLSAGYQSVWQLLPLNPTEGAQGNSPYSALCSRAGNPLFISPELLQKDGLLENIDLTDYYLPQNGHTDFERAEQIKNELLLKAYAGFKNGTNEQEKKDFDQFCKDNRDWLEDFALYMAARNLNYGRPWMEWEAPLKLREAGALHSLSSNEAENIKFFKWVQFVFSRQWKSLRKYCNDRHIQLLGDMPFYVSYNSSDVWSQRELFLLDEDGHITGIAGVAPDGFSGEGQLWGMPVFNWQVHKEHGYEWWIERLRKNTELFDLTRLDHFRAFTDYWIVPGTEKSAIKGEWRPGPGADFFRVAQKALGSLPFVAEDLGEISEDVYRLRDDFNLPGMKVLQFAFGETMAESDYIPHNFTENFIAYTGTHDNNTIRGWFRCETDNEMRARLNEYAGIPVDENNVHLIMARLVYASVAKTAILPVQDVLNLDESCKMNRPGSSQENWTWRLLPGQLTDENKNQLKNWVRLYNRG
jgi:malto-oligosyltrehalose synthase/4-alpha-glucanotransferase